MNYYVVKFTKQPVRYRNPIVVTDTSLFLRDQLLDQGYEIEAIWTCDSYADACEWGSYVATVSSNCGGWV